jgi:transposase
LRRREREERNTAIKHWLSEGRGIKGSAHEVGISPGTVRRFLRGPLGRKPRPSKLAPFEPYIREQVLVHDLSSVLILRELRGLGYQGGYSILKELVKTIRPKKRRRAHLRFETAPGKQGQVDLSPYTVPMGGQPTDVVAFSFVLGYSRWQALHFVLHADAHAVCHAHVLAFDEAGGVPEEILYDRMKQVVLESHRYKVVMHPLFETLRSHYGFRALPLAPGYKEGKGKVENPFRYLEGNFLPKRTFRDIDDLNRQVAAWLRDIARVRIHDTTHERPQDRLQVERPALLRLPAAPFDAARVEERLVGDDFCIRWQSNRYSVSPALVGETATVRELEGVIEILVHGRAVAHHQVRDTRFARYILPEHEAEFRDKSTSRHVLEQQFLRLGPAAKDFVDGLCAEHRGAAGYHMSRILGLADQVGVPRLAEAIRHATRYRAFDFNAVARIVHGKTDQPVAVPPPVGPLPERLTEYLRGAGVHQRSPKSYQQLLLQPKKKEPEDGK